jgi:hypothetical protein
MNVFTTDHPMMSEPSAFVRRVQRWLLVTALAYLVYLLSLGPFLALDGRGVLAFAPESVKYAIVLPATPVYQVPGLRMFYDDYLDWWYHDPVVPYSEPSRW